MTTTQPPAPTGATREIVASILRSLYPRQKTGQPELVVDAWSGDADTFAAALSEKGLVVIDMQRAFDMAVALADAHIDGGDHRAAHCDPHDSGNPGLQSQPE